VKWRFYMSVQIMKVVYHRKTEYQSGGGFLLKQTSTGAFVVVLLLALR